MGTTFDRGAEQTNAYTLVFVIILLGIDIRNVPKQYQEVLQQGRRCGKQ